jgi:hypothetical protein
MKQALHHPLLRTALVATLGLGGISAVGALGADSAGASVRAITFPGTETTVTTGTVSGLNTKKHTFEVAGLNVDTGKNVKYKVTYGTYTNFSNHQKKSTASKLKNGEQNMSVDGFLTGSNIKAIEVSLN